MHCPDQSLKPVVNKMDLSDSGSREFCAVASDSIDLPSSPKTRCVGVSGVGPDMSLKGAVQMTSINACLVLALGGSIEDFGQELCAS